MFNAILFYVLLKCEHEVYPRTWRTKRIEKSIYNI
jgi:hypothetical protein